MRNLFLSGTAVLLLAACSQTTVPEEETVAPKQTEKTVKPVKTGAEDIGNRGEVMMAIQAHGRPDADKEKDADRKAAGVLQFTGVWPGMTVVELEAGSGYYTELLSRIVGRDGKIIMQNPLAFDAFIKPEVFEARLGKNGERLPNVTHSRSNFDVLDVPSGSADLVTWVLGPHELWLKNKEGELTLGAPEKVYAEIYRVLKPGGKFVALDHVAEGEDEFVGGTLHRISAGDCP